VIQQDTSDLALEDRKIAGACIYRARGLLFYTVSLLVQPQIGLMERYLQHPPREPAYRQGRRHAEFVTSLHEHFALGADELTRRLSELLTPPRLRG
jgi:lipoate-protein ligase A